METDLLVSIALLSDLIMKVKYVSFLLFDMFRILLPKQMGVLAVSYLLPNWKSGFRTSLNSLLLILFQALFHWV
jgi:hypothetical protein